QEAVFETVAQNQARVRRTRRECGRGALDRWSFGCPSSAVSSRRHPWHGPCLSILTGEVPSPDNRSVSHAQSHHPGCGLPRGIRGGQFGAACPLARTQNDKPAEGESSGKRQGAARRRCPGPDAERSPDGAPGAKEECARSLRYL